MNSVVIKSANPDLINEAVTSYVSVLKSKHPEIERIIWFGSWINGIPTPGSDVDLCLILSYSDKNMRDRISEYLPIGFPVGIELFPYTKAEFNELALKSIGWYNAIISGKEL